MWTSLIVVSISDWVNLDHLRISTFGWKKPRIQRFSHSYSFRTCSIIGICALVWYLSQSRTRYLCQNNITARVKYHLMPFIPQKFIMFPLQNYRFHHYRCNSRYLSNSAKSHWNISTKNLFDCDWIWNSFESNSLSCGLIFAVIQNAKSHILCISTHFVISALWNCSFKVIISLDGINFIPNNSGLSKNTDIFGKTRIPPKRSMVE